MTRGGDGHRPAASGVFRIVGVGVIGFALSGPGQTLGVSVFVDRFVEDLGLSRSGVATAYLVGTLVAALLIPRVGSLLDRFGVRRTTVAIGLVFGFAIASIAGVVGWISLVGAFIGVRSLGQGALSLASTTWVAKAIGHQRGGPMAATLGLGQLCMALIPLVLAPQILRFGWRTAALMAAALVWLVVPALAWFGMRDPSRTGDDPLADQTEAHDGSGRITPISWTRDAAVRTGMFWVLTAGFSIAGLVHTALTFHHFSILSERGIDAATAAAVFLPSQGGMLAGILVVGWLSDRFTPRILAPVSMGSLALAMGLLIRADSLGEIVVYGLALGFGMGSAWSLEATFLPRYFGPVHIGAIRGITSMTNIASAAIGPVLVAVVVERTGGFNGVLLACIVVCLLIAAAAVTRSDPVRREAAA